jgi:hypothetical protein
MKAICPSDWRVVKWIDHFANPEPKRLVAGYFQRAKDAPPGMDVDASPEQDDQAWWSRESVIRLCHFLQMQSYIWVKSFYGSFALVYTSRLKRHFPPEICFNGRAFPKCGAATSLGRWRRILDPLAAQPWERCTVTIHASQVRATLLRLTIDWSNSAAKIIAFDLTS